MTGYGKLDVVDYPDGPFRSQRVINTLADHIQRRLRSGYERVTFICVSMSGLLAHDVLRELILRRCTLKDPSLLLLDAPSGGVDLVDKRAHLARYIPQIWTPKPLNRRVLGSDTLPTHEKFTTEEQARIWRDHVEASHTFPPLYMIGGQTSYIVRHPGLQKAVLGGVHMAFVQSANDKIIERNAPEHWMAVVGRDIPVLTVNTDFHADLLEHPTEWARGIRLGMDYVLS